ncbi:translation initiation factor IF-2-like [Hyaena hyaena]|uniref:translation initiation factor IF-2-like n=1 Tax=Hyaena hyaena TaxID=95912 RepID=UPI001921750B|nr:translation initiation factor IF-2-like [Hyaena hyaena]
MARGCEGICGQFHNRVCSSGEPASPALAPPGRSLGRGEPGPAPPTPRPEGGGGETFRADRKHFASAAAWLRVRPARPPCPAPAPAPAAAQPRGCRRAARAVPAGPKSTRPRAAPPVRLAHRGGHLGVGLRVAPARPAGPSSRGPEHRSSASAGSCRPPWRRPRLAGHRHARRKVTRCARREGGRRHGEQLPRPITLRGKKWLRVCSCTCIFEEGEGAALSGSGPVSPTWHLLCSQERPRSRPRLGSDGQAHHDVFQDHRLTKTPGSGPLLLAAREDTSSGPPSSMNTRAPSEGGPGICAEKPGKRRGELFRICGLGPAPSSGLMVNVRLRFNAHVAATSEPLTIVSRFMIFHCVQLRVLSRAISSL